MGYHTAEVRHATYLRWKRKLGKRGWKRYFSNPVRMKQRRQAGIRRRKRLGEQRFSKYQRNANLKTKYGITQADYDKMYITQKGLCEMCHLPGKILCVDHNHKTKSIRSLLCHRCNRGLVYVEDSQFTQSAQAYIRLHGTFGSVSKSPPKVTPDAARRRRFASPR